MPIIILRDLVERKYKTTYKLMCISIESEEGTDEQPMEKQRSIRYFCRWTIRYDTANEFNIAKNMHNNLLLEMYDVVDIH